MEDFYYLSRAILVKDERHLDKFDRVFASCFKGLEPPEGVKPQELPDAFLRRCFFHYIRFPDRETMERIVQAHYPDIKQNLAREAMNVFFQVRDVPGLKKKPATSELLDWLKLLMVEDLPVEALRTNEKQLVIPPLHGALLKNEQDVHLFERLAFLARRGG